MRTTGAFLVRAMGWAALLAGVLAAAALASGGDAAEVGRAMPLWLAFGLAVGAYPAGLATGPRAPADWRAAVPVLAGAAVLAAMVVLLAGWIGPALHPAGAAATEARALPLHRVPAALRAAEEGGGAGGWLRANQLAWRLAGDLSLAALAVVLGGIGALVRAWTERVASPQLRHAHRWAVGLCLVAGSYLVHENTYEKLVVPAAQPMYAAGLLVLVGPGLILLCLGWAALLSPPHADAPG